MIEQLFHALSAVLVVMLLSGVGFFLGKKGWLTADSKPFISKLIINVGMPALCVNNVFTYFSRDMLASSGFLLAVCLLAMLLTMGASILLARIMRVDKKRRGVFAVMCGLANTVFVGLPMCTELFGPEAVHYVMLAYLCNTTLFWTVGALIIKRSGSSQNGRMGPVSVLKRMATPPLIAIILSIIALLIGLRPPEPVISLCSYLSGLVTPLGLIYVGFVISETGLRGMRMSGQMAAVMAMRFLFAPAAMLLICGAAGISGFPRDVFVIESAMPVMTQAVVLAADAGADERFAASGITITMLACFAAVPLLTLILA